MEELKHLAIKGIFIERQYGSNINISQSEKRSIINLIKKMAYDEISLTGMKINAILKIKVYENSNFVYLDISGRCKAPTKFKFSTAIEHELELHLGVNKKHSVLNFVDRETGEIRQISKEVNYFK